MKKVELKARFNEFYNITYRRAMVYCLANTGDFINAEDLLADVYYEIYKRFLKDKRGVFAEPEKYLVSLLDHRLLKYWKKHRKELEAPAIDGNIAYEALLEKNFDLSAETAARQMLVQDILEYVSGRPAPMRRAFAMYFYLNYSIEETAAELNTSDEEVAAYVYLMLQEIEENFLEDYE